MTLVTVCKQIIVRFANSEFCVLHVTTTIAYMYGILRLPTQLAQKLILKKVITGLRILSAEFDGE